MKTTPTTELASLLIGEDLGQWLAQRREQGRTWAGLAADLDDATNGKVQVSREAIRLWFLEPATQEPEQRAAS